MPFRRSVLVVAAAFLAVYLIWGSTYLAIHFAIQSLPPFLMAGARWILAGGALYAWMRLRGEAAPKLVHWRSAAIIGGLLIVGGNGTVSWAQQFVPSGLTALLIAIVPVWIALLEWLGPRRVRPSPRVVAGILLGLGGVSLLVGPHVLFALGGAGGAALLGVVCILGAAFSWANGSLYSRGAPRPKGLLLGAAMQMLCGGLVLAALGLLAGEADDVHLTAVSASSWLAFGFLVVFGSVVAYSAYVWLLQVVRAEMVATYAFVNPVVAVVLGVLLAGEAFTTRTALVAALIVVAVGLVVTAPKPRVEAAAPPLAPAADASGRT